jgi:hypothetical protein
MKPVHIGVGALFLMTGLAAGQETRVPQGTPPPNATTMMMAGPEHGVLFIEPMDHKVVKGAPYTATATTESTQVLADGNRIVHKQSGLVARDGQGRTRREETMGRMGPVEMNGSKMIMIHDPVAQTMYMLNPDKQTAHVMKHDGNMAMTHMQMHQKMMKAMAQDEKAEIKTEPLGTQEIGGVTAQGKRVTRTIPAGAIGNEQPIQITVETWTSPELQTVVLQKRNDPRFGETVFQLTDIKQGEPDASLFQVPAGYKVVQGMGMKMRMSHEPAPSE